MRFFHRFWFIISLLRGLQSKALDSMRYGLGLVNARWDLVSTSSAWWLSWNSRDHRACTITTVLVRNGVHERYWPTMDVDVTTLWKRFTDPDTNFQQPLDAVKMTIMLLVETFHSESNYRKNVSSWLFSWVKELEQFNSSPWENMCTRWHLSICTKFMEFLWFFHSSPPFELRYNLAAWSNMVVTLSFLNLFMMFCFMWNP